MRRLLLLALLAGLLLSGCTRFPADPDGTLDRVTGGTLRVGVSPNPPETELGSGTEPGGTEIALVRDFAATMPAQVEWTVGGEEMLVLALERGELDLVVGGLTADTPWVEQAAISIPYAETTDPTGDRVQLVLAAPPGENAFLLRLERFLRARGTP